MLDNKQDNLVNGNYVSVDENKVLQLDTQMLMRVIKIDDLATTLGDVKDIVDEVNENGEHVVFDVASLGQSMYLVSILIENNRVVISNWLNSDEQFKGFYNADILLKDCLYDIGKEIYGIKRQINSSSSTWERTDNNVGKVANATKDGTSAVNDFDYIYPWNEIKTVNMASDGTINAVIGDDNFKFDGTNGDVMTYIPEFYWDRYQENGYEYIKVSRDRFTNSKKSEAFYVGRYHTGTGALSKSGVRPQFSTSITNFRTQAQAKGSKWQQLDYHYFLLQMLYLVEYADYNSQSKLGNGVTSIRYVATDTAILDETLTNRIVIATDNSAYEVGTYIYIGTSQGSTNKADCRKITDKVNEDGGTAIYFDGEPVNIAVGNVLWGGAQAEGECDELGMLSGCLNNNGRHSNIYRGIENPFGNVYQFIDGLNIKDNVAYINYKPSTYQVDKFDGDYEALGYVNANANGYGKAVGYDSEHPMVALDTEIGGGTTTYLCDYYYQNTGNRIACVGGYFGNGASAGLWYWFLGSGSGVADLHIGSRLFRTI